MRVERTALRDKSALLEDELAVQQGRTRELAADNTALAAALNEQRSRAVSQQKEILRLQRLLDQQANRLAPSVSPASPVRGVHC
ncbi:hypothetical protein EON64_17965 [archaeon]|nr:MAG: hypothetical protein EON64_17965 [archaeon]